ncbi:PLP-dependent aminotransferase family protein [Dietzia psychralcaliphila]|uniref:GntR family transcriptional regulator n=2 Tax=Dietzia psychralcaliphila TaxID=139021 RepID=A0AAD0JS41_9ACTN|nr:PLP-dependent aminotransferase family protein [Dietzia psychralcaliphila]AWH96875.1 GntR family transcriptional regulator [Dietzia psychralcaliphila]PTM89532.1 GntR family transcriptional regulator [Dietzia psychralcaliphila]
MARTARPGSLVLGQVTGTADLVDAIIDLVADGSLADGDRLPSTRALAEQTGLSRGTVVRAFDELSAAGFADSTQGSGTRVAAGAGLAARAGARTRGGGDTSSSSRSSSSRSATTWSPPVPEPRRGRSARDLRPGIPDVALVDQRAWRSAVRAAAAQGLAGLNPWEEPSPTLRAELADHLRRHRGIAAADPLLFDSSRSAIAALCSAFVAAHGRVPFHMEDPGYRGALLMAREHDLEVRFHPAEPGGLDAARLGSARAIVFTTPAHQFPLGHRMSVDRRVALVEWAQRTGSLVIEDDYDGEFRYGVAPLPALATLPAADGHVAYVGTSSKSVAPDLRVAWCLAPAALRREVDRWLVVHRRGPSTLPAEALGAFIGSGAMDRHLARAARVYSDRRHHLVAALTRECPRLSVTGVEAGLHLCVLLPGYDDDEVVRELDRAGWRTRALSGQSARYAVPGLVLSYSRLVARDAGEFAAELRGVIDSAGPAVSSGGQAPATPS